LRSSANSRSHLIILNLSTTLITNNVAPQYRGDGIFQTV
jgi:hypothetical protein